MRQLTHHAVRQMGFSKVAELPVTMGGSREGPNQAVIALVADVLDHPAVTFALALVVGHETIFSLSLRRKPEHRPTETEADNREAKAYAGRA